MNVGFQLRLDNRLVLQVPDELVPLREVIPDLLEQIRTRVHDRGLDADMQPWSRWVVEDPDGPLYWTSPGMPQPEKGRINRSRDGMRAAYASRSAYREAVGLPRPPNKRFVMTTALRNSLRDTYQGRTVAVISYPRTKHVSPYGSANVTNARVASLVFDRERLSPVEPSQAELADLEKRMAAVARARILVGEQSASPGAGPLKGQRLF